jgi:hypothetical protein
MIFDAGVEYGMKSIVIGVRLAQELSSLAISQAKPLIDMAKELRPDATQIAKEAGLAMGGEFAGRMFDYFETKLPAPGKQEAPIQNPLLDMFYRTFQSTINRLYKIPGSNEPGATTPGFVDKRGKQGG